MAPFPGFGGMDLAMIPTPPEPPARTIRGTFSGGRPYRTNGLSFTASSSVTGRGPETSHPAFPLPCPREFAIFRARVYASSFSRSYKISTFSGGTPFSSSTNLLLSKNVYRGLVRSTHARACEAFTEIASASWLSLAIRRSTAWTLLLASAAPDFASVASDLAFPASPFACPDCMIAVPESWIAFWARLSASSALSLREPITRPDMSLVWTRHISSSDNAPTRSSVERLAIGSLCAMIHWRLLNSERYSPKQAMVTSAATTYSACSHHQSSRASDATSDEVDIILAHSRASVKVVVLGSFWSSRRFTPARKQADGKRFAFSLPEERSYASLAKSPCPPVASSASQRGYIFLKSAMIMSYGTSG